MTIRPFATHRLFLKHIFLPLVLVLVFVLPAQAHKVMVFGWVEDGQVKTISKFSGGKKVKQGTIRVYNDAGALLLEGITDDLGEFSFDIPGKTGLKIELEAAMGHKNISLIPADQFTAPGEEPLARNVNHPNPVISQEPSAIPMEDLEKHMERVIERKVTPLLRQLVERESKPRLADILGGIGYIVGLAGLYLAMKHKKKD